METVTVTLSGSLKEFVEDQVGAGKYQSAGDYITALLTEAQERKAWDKVEALVLEGLNSGDGIVVSEEFWEKKARRLNERYPEVKDP